MKSAELLAGGTKLTVAATDSGPVLTLPAAAPDAICSTIKLLVQGKPEVVEATVSAGPDGVIRLLPEDAGFEGDVKAEEKGGESNVGFWTNYKDSVSWSLRANRDGKYAVLIEASAPSAGSVLTIEGVGKLTFPVPKTDSYESFQSSKAGEVTLKKGDKLRLTLRPVANNWHPVNVRKLERSPALSREEKGVPLPCKPDSVRALAELDGHFSPRKRGAPLTRSATNTRELTDGPPFPCSVLHRMGFVLPLRLPSARWALTPPFQPYLCPGAIGGVFSVALSVRFLAFPSPVFTRHPALWCPDFPHPPLARNCDRPGSGNAHLRLPRLGFRGERAWGLES